MSTVASPTREGHLVQKLKEGIQDAVVFLRMLEQFKIPAIVESRRKKLLERLLLVQDDSLKQVPPSFEPESEQNPSPLKRGDSLVGERVKQLEETDSASKREVTSPKRKASSPEPVPEEKEKTPEKKDATPQASPAVVRRDKKRGLTPERPSSAVSTGSTEQEKEETKKHSTLGLPKKRFFKKNKSKGSKDDKAETSSQISTEDVEAAAAAMEADTDKDVKLQTQLEWRAAKKRLGGSSWTKLMVKLKDFTLLIGEKDKLELVSCTVGVSAKSGANAFEVFSHPDHKQFVFRAESVEVRDQWISVLQEAIQECTPANPESTEQTNGQPEEAAATEEPKPETEVPKITVETTEPQEEPSEETKTGKKNKRESKAYTGKKESQKRSEIPDQGVEMKGFLHRKTWKGWDKCWCVLTYNAAYFTSSEDNADYSNMLQFSEGSGSLKQQKKGHDKQSQSLVIKVGKRSETLSVDSGDYLRWKDALEQVLGIGGGLELGSEEEEEFEGAEPIDEDLYEEVDRAIERVPPVPASPRPSQRAIIPEADEFDGEDIYEEFDEPLPQPPPSKAPALPPRNDPKPSIPAPVLPPRNDPLRGISPAPPSLPPRDIPSSKSVKQQVQDYEVSSPSSKKPSTWPPPPDEDELYDDIVHPQGEVEETYDDVVVEKSDTLEETYDDVVATKDRPGSPLSENYEDMEPTQEGPEEYVVMEPGQEEEGELYVEVDPEGPIFAVGLGKPVTETPTSPPPNDVKAEKGGGTFARMLGKKQSKQQVQAPRLQLSYKAPGKSKFKDEWCAVDGSILQFFKSSSDKKAHDKLALSGLDLSVNAPGSDAAEYGFKLLKGDKTHHFTCKSREDVDGWVAVLKGQVKQALINLPIEEQQVYVAKEDHIGDNEEQLTFKKGCYIRLLREDSKDMWTGQLGNEAQNFEGKIGLFPASKVELAEDLYI